MERKRKLPARAAARVEHVAKKRNVTPHERSVTPATPQPVEEPPPPPPPSLPRSIQPGKPLPTVEEAQPDGLCAKEYQSVSESGVLAESLSRSRQKWISEGLFEKYWTKPHKRKGVVTEDPKNPPKDLMSKIGTVTITIEPHIIEATMYAVKDPKPRPPQPAPGQPAASSSPAQQPHATPQTRPIIQYGPPNGAMPPPPTPGSVAASPTVSTSGVSKPEAPSPAQASPRPSPVSQIAQTGQPTPPQESPKLPNPTGAPPAISTNISSPQPVLPQAPVSQVAPQPSPIAPRLPSPAQGPPPAHVTPLPRPIPPASTQPGLASPSPARPPSATPIKPAIAAAPAPPPPGVSPAGVRPYGAHSTGSARPPGPLAKPSAPGANTAAAPAPAAKPAANDPVIALLAQKASRDPELRDLMKRVAVGQAKEGELDHFQKIIDQLNAEYKRKGGQQGPSADRLVVDGRTVKYFADEVRMILDVVLTSNPQQKSSELRPPPGSDALVVLLVKKALEDFKTKDMIHRIANGQPSPTDASELKEILDRLHREMKAIPPKTPVQAAAAPPARQAATNGVPNGQAKPPATQSAPNAQALRSKGPPPAPKPDISAVVFDFGSGDRYLFPKYSILEYLPTNSGQQVVASFLIVRKGSISDYGGDPDLDYYQPVTIRLSTPTGRHLENLARVVAPQHEVRRYMDDVMDNMTRAEYVLLAMQLPRASKDGESEASDEPAKTTASTPKADGEAEKGAASSKPSVLWNSTAPTTSSRGRSRDTRDPEEESQSRYHKLINSVAARDTESA